MAEDIVYYRAKSSFSDPQNIVNTIALILLLPEIRDIVPVGYLPLLTAVTAVLNLLLRQTTSTRPVAFIKPGTSAAVQVKKLD
jgi:hypothetical protein